MATIIVSREVNAPIRQVFNTVADIRELRKALPHVIEVEFLTERQVGVGTRFRETRRMSESQTSTTELDVKEYVENDRVRLVAESHGTVWDSVFRVRTWNGRTLLSLTMDAKTRKLLPALMFFFIRPMLKKAMARDLDAVKAFCEGRPLEA